MEVWNWYSLKSLSLKCGTSKKEKNYKRQFIYVDFYN